MSVTEPHWTTSPFLNNELIFNKCPATSSILCAVIMVYRSNLMILDKCLKFPWLLTWL